MHVLQERGSVRARLYLPLPNSHRLNGDHHHTNSLYNHNNVAISHSHLSSSTISRLYSLSPRTCNFRLHNLHPRKSLLSQPVFRSLHSIPSPRTASPTTSHTTIQTLHYPCLPSSLGSHSPSFGPSN